MSMSLLTFFLPHFPRQLQGRAKAVQSTLLTKGLRQLSELALPDLAALLQKKKDARHLVG